MRRLPLTQGQVALIDDVDWERVSQFRWHAVWVYNTYYAATTADGKRLYLHRFLTDAPKGMEVDHINGDGLDNRRENLRLCRHRDNLRNVRRTIPSRSGYRGVIPTASGKFAARCKHFGKLLYFGTFETAEEAARVRDIEVLRLHGEFAVLNFPREEYEDEVAS